MASASTRSRRAVAVKTMIASAWAAPYRLTKRFRIDGEASDGHLGPGGKVGTSFLYSERTTFT